MIQDIAQMYSVVLVTPRGHNFRHLKLKLGSEAFKFVSWMIRSGWTRSDLVPLRPPDSDVTRTAAGRRCTATVTAAAAAAAGPGPAALRLARWNRVCRGHAHHGHDVQGSSYYWASTGRAA